MMITDAKADDHARHREDYAGRPFVPAQQISPQGCREDRDELLGQRQEKETVRKFQGIDHDEGE
jgi:hypothetical protein